MKRSKLFLAIGAMILATAGAYASISKVVAENYYRYTAAGACILTQLTKGCTAAGVGCSTAGIQLYQSRTAPRVCAVSLRKPV